MKASTPGRRGCNFYLIAATMAQITLSIVVAILWVRYVSGSTLTAIP